MSVTADMWCWL